jgi:hypothetical protein
VKKSKKRGKKGQLQYSELAQNTAKGVLKAKVLGPRLLLLSMLPFVEADDIPGCNLVMRAWLTNGTNFPELVKWTKDHKNDEDIRPVLDWFRENLLGDQKKFAMRQEDARAQAWIDALPEVEVLDE